MDEAELTLTPIPRDDVDEYVARRQCPHDHETVRVDNGTYHVQCPHCAAWSVAISV
jgi:hypothetical protein